MHCSIPTMCALSRVVDVIHTWVEKAAIKVHKTLCLWMATGALSLNCVQNSMPFKSSLQLSWVGALRLYEVLYQQVTSNKLLVISSQTPSTNVYCITASSEQTHTHIYAPRFATLALVESGGGAYMRDLTFYLENTPPLPGPRLDVDIDRFSIDTINLY